jgi:hypothetical protein
MSIIDTIKADAGAVGSFLVAEEQKILAFAKPAIPAVEAAFSALIKDAQAQGSQLVGIAQGPLATDIAAIEADFETAIANGLSRLTGGDATVKALESALAAEGVQYVAGALEGLVKPLVVKVLASLLPAPTA